MDPIPQKHIDKLCTSKEAYSKKYAEAKIRSARKRGKIISPTLKVYKCAFCPFHHIGHAYVYNPDYKKEKL